MNCLDQVVNVCIVGRRSQFRIQQCWYWLFWVLGLLARPAKETFCLNNRETYERIVTCNKLPFPPVPAPPVCVVEWHRARCGARRPPLNGERHGAWSMEHGSWSMDHGGWIQDPGRALEDHM